ncbi:MAG TPA: collagen-like protein [Terriglobales bacterium]|nr:collagen-like protein [Terriglobales bacterium]
MTLLSYGYRPGVLFTSILAIVVVGVIAVVASWILKSGHLGRIGNFFAWAIVILFVIATALFVTSIFFGVPSRGSILVARVFNDVDFMSTSGQTNLAITTPTTFGAFPTEYREWQAPTGGDIFDRTSALTYLGTLTIENATVLNASDRPRQLYAHTLVLRGATLQTDGGDLAIEVVNLVADGGTIRSFDNSSALPTNSHGRSGGTVTLTVLGHVSGRLRVDLRGQAGAPGRDGTIGGPGGPGQPGDNAAMSLLGCARGGGNGGAGSPGQPGQPGSNGANGGAGGKLVVKAADVAAVRAAILFTAAGGPGGEGGRGGPGGPGGPGGLGGGGTGLCSGGQRGADGPQGPRGQDGRPGTAGEDGDLSILPYRQTH